MEPFAVIIAVAIALVLLGYAGALAWVAVRRMQGDEEVENSIVARLLRLLPW